MSDKEKDQTTRWENVKGRAQHLHGQPDSVTWLKEFGEPMPLGAAFAMALCEEMDQMQVEFETEMKVLTKRLKNLKKGNDVLRDMLTKHVSYKTIRRYDVEEPKE